MESVEYRDIPGYPGYRVGSDGTFWTLRMRGPGSAMRSIWRQVMPNLQRHGYLTVGLEGRTKRFHRLVLLAFEGPCPEGMEALHRNGIRTDNRLENLRWGTHLENQSQRREHGTNRPGTQNNNAKLIEEDIPLIRQRRASGATMEAIAAEFGVCRTSIARVLNGVGWTRVAEVMAAQPKGLGNEQRQPAAGN